MAIPREPPPARDAKPRPRSLSPTKAPLPSAAACCPLSGQEPTRGRATSPKNGNPMNFPARGLHLGHPRGHGAAPAGGSHPFFYVRRHAGRKGLERAPKGHSKSGRKAARSSGRRRGYCLCRWPEGFLGPVWKEKTCAWFFFFSLCPLPRGCWEHKRGGGDARLLPVVPSRWPRSRCPLGFLRLATLCAFSLAEEGCMN